jgi:hypothetical protein
MIKFMKMYRDGLDPRHDISVFCRKGPDVPDTQSQVVQNVPYLDGYVQDAAQAAQGLYNANQGFQSREQIYNNLLPQYTNDVGTGYFVTPDGVTVSRDNYATALQGSAKDNFGMYLNALDQGGDLSSFQGYEQLGGGSEIDYDGLNAAVDQAFNAQDPDASTYYPDSTVVPFSQQTEDALAGMEARARAGSDVTRNASQLTADTLAGNYLDSNPYIDDIVQYSTQDITDNYLNNILPQLNSTFAQSGRYGSGAQALAYGDTTGEYLDSVGKTGAQIRYQNYADERNRQGQYAALSPTIAGQEYADYQQLAGVGSAREGLDRAYLQEDMDRYYYDLNYPQQQLDQYINRINTLNGNFGTSTGVTTGAATPSGGLSGAISGGATGLGLGSTLAPMLFGNGIVAGTGGLGAGSSMGAALGAVGGPLGIGLGVGGALLGGLL